MLEDPSTPPSDSAPPGRGAPRVGAAFAGETTGAPLPETPSAGDPTVMMSAPRSETVGDFEIITKLGQGGMGAVYRARQISLDRQIALKLLPASLEADAEFVSRFQREARVAASLSHANLVKVYASGEADGSHFIAMELIEGETLGDLLKRGALPPLEALRICGDVARALDHGWQRAQLIHRDIKPGNIFLSQRGEVKVGDLGLAKTMGGDTTGLTHTGTAMGTPHYISPEQARGDKDLDFRADIYSLGCTVFQMLTGRTPYEGRDPMNVMYQHINSPPPAILKVLPGCPIPLARLVGKMLKKIKRERQASYAELLAEIERVAALFTPTASVLESTFPPDPDSTLLATPGNTPRSATPVGQAPRLPGTGSAAAGAAALQPGSTPKTKLPLYGAIAAGLAVLVVVIFAVLPKKEKLTKAELYAREQEVKRAQTTTPSALPAKPADSSAENWQPAGPDSGKLTRTPEGLRAEGFLTFKKGPRKDGAVRVRAPFSPEFLKIRLVARMTGAPPNLYHAFVQDAGDRGYFQYRNDGKFSGLEGSKSTPLPTALRPGEPCELEFRIVGTHVTIKINGQTMTEGEHHALSEGMFGMYLTDTSVVTLQSLEYLDLDAVSAKNTSSAATWTDALAAWWAGGKVNDNFVQLPGGFTKAELGGALGYQVDRPFSRDQAARVVFRLEGSPNLEVLLRRSLTGTDASHPKAILEPGKGKIRIALSTPNGIGDKALNDVPLPAGFDPAARHTLEFRVVGDTLTAILDEKTLYTGHNSRLAQDGYPAIVARPGAIIEKFEVLNLDPPGGASAASPPAAADTLTFGGHRYRVVRERMPWEAAKARAEQMGGHLATVTSKAEDEAIRVAFGSAIPQGLQFL